MWGHIPIVNHKFIYIRATSTLAGDDDSVSSVLFPLSAFRGFFFTDINMIYMTYEAPYQYVMADNDDCDGAVLVIPVNEHKAFMTEFVREITFGDSAVIVMRDDVTGEGFDGITNAVITSNTKAD